MYKYFKDAIKADPGAPEPVATTSSADTPKKATKGSTGAGKSGGKVKAEPDDEVETKAAKSGGGKSGSKTKSGAKERPAGNFLIPLLCCHFVFSSASLLLTLSEISYQVISRILNKYSS
jgi:hypothetical protein